MPGRTIATAEGTLRLVPPDLNDLRRLRRTWPFGVLRFHEHDGADTGIVLQCGDQELFGIKFQPPDVPDNETATMLFQIHRMLIARSMAYWLEEALEAALLPVTYLRNKGEHGFESGIACFCYPESEAHDDPKSAEDVVTRPSEEALELAAKWFGTLGDALQELDIDYQITILGVDVRPRSQLESIQMDFVAHRGGVYSLARKVHDQDPIWSQLASENVTELPHIPAIPMTIAAEDFRRAKGLEKFHP